MTDARQAADWRGAVELYPDLAGVLTECTARLSAGRHGNAARWLAALTNLPDAAPGQIELGSTVRIGTAADLHDGQRARLLEALRELHPWRKGPFEFFGTHIDTEWRSDWKWERIAPFLGRLDGMCILDVGSGNGYYGWRMLESGADFVIGVDPTIVFNMQHRATSFYMPELAPRNIVLPLKFEELPTGPRFDLVFSMGVIYHRRDPREHVERIYSHVAPGGLVVLESLIVGPEHAPCLEPGDRYARMRNVWVVPTVEMLLLWLSEGGFNDAEVISVQRTTLDEQRSTDWMRFESLAEALDADDRERTIEGYPAPVRAVVVARRGA